MATPLRRLSCQTLDNHMKTDTSSDSTTTLVFCRPGVDSSFITRTLGIQPTESKAAIDPSDIGTWKLSINMLAESNTIEAQIGEWLHFLEPRGEALASLLGLGYSPYLDCRAEPRSLSLCIEPENLIRLGKLGISLSVWLYEYPLQPIV